MDLNLSDLQDETIVRKVIPAYISKVRDEVGSWLTWKDLHASTNICGDRIGLS